MAAKKKSDPIILGMDGRAMKPAPPWKWIVLLALLFIGFLVVHNGAPLYADWLWFHEVGYPTVFTTTIFAKTGLYLGFGLLFFLVFYGNLQIARRLAPDVASQFVMERFGPKWGKSLQKWIGWVLLAVGLFFSLWAGRLASENWAGWLEFTHATPFGVKDPVFGRDISFFVFQLPFWHFVWEFCLGTLIFTLAAVICLYVANRAIETVAGLPNVSPGIRTQLLVLVALLALTQAFGTHLGAYDLLTNDHRIFAGADYTDLHYRLLAINVQMILLIVTALACFIPVWRGKGFRWPVVAAGGWLAALLVLGGIVPGVVQKTFVEPNEFSLEQPYIKRSIAFTRRGFNLENVQSVNDFPADQSLTAAGIAANRDTLDNVRLWDYPYLGKVYSQLETVKSYYKFEKVSVGGEREYNIDIDRYRIGGRLRQVMLGAREMDTSGLPESAQSWQNQKLSYTHGYGLAMSPVNKTIQGLPDYFLSGIPVKSSPEASELHVSQPAIYYGQLEHSYVFVDSEQSEFDYPSTEISGANGEAQDHTTRYQGRGGIPIGNSALARWAFSLQLGDPNILLTRSFTPRTRLLYRRDIRDRIQTVAPFVQQDGDPYLVLEPDSGHLVWVVDCYTLSDQYPYSTPQKMELNSAQYIETNYIRNSIKATVDAYDGTINCYVSDPDDPIARTYGKIYPGLLKPLDAMPAGLRAHIRYPEDLFRLQRAVYASYHVDDPRIFYFREDTWAIPTEPNADLNAQKEGAAPKQMEPYYVIMRLPDIGGQEGVGGRVWGVGNAAPYTLHPTPHTLPPTPEEFLLMSPLAPVKREGQNILGWMCARCDGEHYGKLVLYRFPQQVSVNGPSQVIAYMNNDPVISPQLTPLRLAGSTATFGNLLVIPVENSLLYIAPLYVESTSGATSLPKLQKVVVAFGERVAMGDTLPKALADLFPPDNSAGNGKPGPSGGAVPSAPPGSSPTPVPQGVRTLIQRVASQYDAAKQKLKTGDLAGYAAAMKEVERSLEDLKKQASASGK